MFEAKDIIETISMIREECLDIRTITMGISLYDCQCDNADRLATRIYDRIMSRARDLVKTGEEIEKRVGELSGGELAALGLEGPAIGAAQRRLAAHILAHPEDNTPARLLALARAELSGP